MCILSAAPGVALDAPPGVASACLSRCEQRCSDLTQHEVRVLAVLTAHSKRGSLARHHVGPLAAAHARRKALDVSVAGFEFTFSLGKPVSSNKVVGSADAGVVLDSLFDNSATLKISPLGAKFDISLLNTARLDAVAFGTTKNLMAAEAR